jgi:predicted AAA+ superfamily ATPase
MDTVIKEDISLLTRIIDRDYLYDLYSLLPEMVSNPISQSSLASHLELSPPTIKNYLRRLEEFYLTFRIYPYSKNIKRSLLKAPKCYLYNWTQVKEEGKRFENFVAVQLYTLLHLWRDATGEDMALFYIRNKQKQETDFLLTKNEIPWLLIETKYSDSPIESHHFKAQAMLGDIALVQLCRQENIAQLQTRNSFRLSASRLLS